MDNLKHIVIADPDIEYIKNYEEDFVRSFRSRAMIQVITENAYLENYFRLHRDIDVLLIAKEFNGEYLSEHNISHMMIINEERNVEGMAENAPFNILNYKSKEEIFSFVEAALADEESEDAASEDKVEASEEEQKDVRVISVYSPNGGSGKSLAAVALAKKLKKLGETVLVIGCDDLQSFGVFLETTESADPELALYLNEISENTYWAILKNIYMGDAAYLLPFEKALSALGIGSVQLYSMIMLLKEKRDFSYIILDLGSSFDERVQALLSASDICVLVAESKMSSCRMMSKFMQNINESSIPQIYTIANQYRTEGFRLENENLFGSFAGYETAAEAMEDPLFYRLALKLSE